MYHRAAGYEKKISTGTKPADPPVEQPAAGREQTSQIHGGPVRF
jgi:hypothetical protein